MFRPGRASGLLVISALAGCGGVRVSVDARLVEDSTLWRHLDGPTYRIVGVSPEAESSLEFQEFAGLLAAAFREPRPNLRRVRGGPAASAPPTSEVPAAPAPSRPDLVLTFSFQVYDRGTAVESYPLYGTRRTRVYRPYGPSYGYYSSFYAGQAVQTVPLGFAHSAALTAWIWDSTQSSGRRVIWEGRAGLVSGNPDLRSSMPYLAMALAITYGQPTEEGPMVISFKNDDERVKSLATAR